MTDIPNTKYITINKDGIFVGGKPATTYRGEEIYGIDYVKKAFELMQRQNPDVEEFHVGAFKTPGKYAKAGNPSGECGPNAWCRIKLRGMDVPSALWVFDCSYPSVTDCAYFCANYCMSFVRARVGFRTAVLEAAESQVRPRITPNQIVIEKLAQDTKVKGK